MSTHDPEDPKTGPGSTEDPNQGNRTGLPKGPESGAKVEADTSDPDDPKTGPGSTSDPNQANRT